MKTIVVLCCALLALAKGRTIETNLDSKPRVVNGEKAKLGERPYQVALYSHKSFHCGGSILNDYWVFTAAHCVEGKSPSTELVVAGTVDLKDPYSLHQVEQIIVHDGFAPSDSYKNDIALMKVINPFTFSSRLKPAILPEPHAKVKTNSTTIVSGWGYTSNGSLPNLLQIATVYITDPKVCQAAVQERGYNVYPTQICANNPTIRRGECNGDSGGPVTVDGVLTGIVSWSIKDPDCGSPHFPGVHTRVSEYIDWINEHINPPSAHVFLSFF